VLFVTLSWKLPVSYLSLSKVRVVQVFGVADDVCVDEEYTLAPDDCVDRVVPERDKPLHTVIS